MDYYSAKLNILHFLEIRLIVGERGTSPKFSKFLEGAKFKLILIMWNFDYSITVQDS